MLVRESSFCLKASPSTGSLCNDADLTRPSRLCRTAASANKALAPSGFTGGTLFFGVPLFCKRDAVFRKRGPHIRPIPAPSPVRPLSRSADHWSAAVQSTSTSTSGESASGRPKHVIASQCRNTGAAIRFLCAAQPVFCQPWANPHPAACLHLVCGKEKRIDFTAGFFYNGDTGRTAFPKPSAVRL